MTVDDLLERRRTPLLRLVTATLATCFIIGAAFVSLHGWKGKTEIVGPASIDPIQTGSISVGHAPSADPIQTASIPVGDAIGDMIEKLDTKAARQHR
jgi:hypothetical protein